MIEAIIAYIQDQGYVVEVMEGCLMIRKYIDGQLLSLGWWIDPIDLQYAPKDGLFAVADWKIAEMRRAEQEYWKRVEETEA